ncbi:hypothetical protein FQN54_001266 [Arachnomyces sp. PD_36]|nr:hypothetical protein FQN54_001266 [Arachnomyces sp. PD_36]
MADDGPLHVFDLPQLYTKPAAAEILKALELLTVRPPTFDGLKNVASEVREIIPTGVTRYLTSIVASELSWVECDDTKESIWDAASTRLSERSGRMAMPAISRVFTVPVSSTENVSLTLHEPSLTSDNLGMKTWVSSYLLAKRLALAHAPEQPLLPADSSVNQKLRVLELGAGTGLVGLAFASIWGSAASVHLTDLPAIVPNLAHNVTLNEEILEQAGAGCTTGVLDWSIVHEAPPPDEEKYEVILAADPLYSSDHPPWLVQTINRWLSRDKGARVMVEMCLRDAYLPQVEDFRKRMHAIGLSPIDEGTEIGYDDWESSDGESLEVRCWWSVWSWD